MSAFDAYMRTMDALGSAAAAGFARPLAFAQALTELESGAADYPADLRDLVARVAGDCRNEPANAAKLLRRAGERIGAIGQISERAENAAAADALIRAAAAVAGGVQ